MTRLFRRLFSLFGVRKVNVPNLINKTRTQAQSELSAIGLNYSESSSNTSDANLGLLVFSQGVAAGSVVPIGSSVNFSYYNFIAPPNFNPQPTFNPGPTFNPQPHFPGPTFNPQPHFPGPVFIPNPVFVPEPFFLPEPWFSAEPHFTTAGPYFNPNGPFFYVPPYFNPAPLFLGPGPLFFTPYFKSVGVSTLIRTTDGLVRADDLSVGDTLLSANINGFPYQSEEGVTQQALTWSDLNPNIELVETTVVSINRRQSDCAIVINNDIFSAFHYILVKRNDEAKFVISTDVLETDLLYSYDNLSWEPITIYENVNVQHEVVSINCEPYDMFFTEKMLVHDSVSI